MQRGPLTDTIVDGFDDMSKQLQAAARYILDNPREVALLSMREQARRGEVQPATMTRLAKHLGFAGYEDVRQLYADYLRGEDSGFAPRVDAQAQNQRLKGDQALAAEILRGAGIHVVALADSAGLESLVEAARHIERARRVYCLGLRSSYPVAWHLHYMLALAGGNATMLESAGGIGPDVLSSAASQDVLVAVSVMPYTRQTVEIVDYAQSLGVRIVAITDSPVAPLAQLAAAAVVVPTESPSFLHTMAPAFMVAEILGALVAGHGGDAAREAIARADRQSAALNTHIKNRAKRS
ncbi:MurR/RpiR family transcriptional regulator [Mesorhizobium sp. 1B3]|uniref:MurR/RpiR family transcriptional regulator n=1 Tax=Mesorhizobium sp. 1B3 TaxID=3243599 RepID=UPI003D96D0CB